LSVLVGMHGAVNPAGSVRCNMGIDKVGEWFQSNSNVVWRQRPEKHFATELS
jgi:hypothetical protein